MRLLLLSVILVSSSILFAQSHNKGAFSFNLGFDGGVHGTSYTSKYQGNLVDGPDTSAAGTNLIRFNAHYNIFKWMSVGLDFRNGKYIEDPENATANGNKVSMYGIGLRFYPVNREKFAWYLGSTFGGSRLEINRIYTIIVAFPARYKLTSGHFGLETGFNWYFAKNFGMNFGLGYSSQNYLLNEFYFNGEKQDITDYENRILTKGIHFNLGLAFHFGGR